MVLSFNGRVNIAVNQVKDKYPKAKLFEVHGSTSCGSTNDPKQIDQLELIFFHTEKSHIKIQSTGYAEFGEAEVIDEMWCESAMFDWPIDMDIDEAHMLKESAGFMRDYSHVTLRQPLHPKFKHPCFIFDQVFVDTVTKEVF